LRCSLYPKGRDVNKLTIAAAMLTVTFSGMAMAQQAPGDLLGDKTVSRADAQAAAGQRFDQIDTDHNGSVSEEELQAGRPGRPGGPGGNREHGGLAARMDADGDGKISKQEYVATQTRRFDMIDADKDGQLTKAERDAARARMQGLRGGGGNWGGGAGGAAGAAGAGAGWGGSPDGN
jgi:hypothetical protein